MYMWQPWCPSKNYYWEASFINIEERCVYSSTQHLQFKASFINSEEYSSTQRLQFNIFYWRERTVEKEPEIRQLQNVVYVTYICFRCSWTLSRQKHCTWTLLEKAVYTEVTWVCIFRCAKGLKHAFISRRRGFRSLVAMCSAGRKHASKLVKSNSCLLSGWDYNQICGYVKVVTTCLHWSGFQHAFYIDVGVI